jgi:hypothetical protein
MKTLVEENKVLLLLFYYFYFYQCCRMGRGVNQVKKILSDFYHSKMKFF